MLRFRLRLLFWQLLSAKFPLFKDVESIQGVDHKLQTEKDVKSEFKGSKINQSFLVPVCGECGYLAPHFRHSDEGV